MYDGKRAALAALQRVLCHEGGGGTYVVNAHYAASNRAQTRCFTGHRRIKIQCAISHGRNNTKTRRQMQA